MPESLIPAVSSSAENTPLVVPGLGAASVPKSTLSGLQRNGLSGGPPLEILTRPTALDFHADGAKAAFRCVIVLQHMRNPERRL